MSIKNKIIEVFNNEQSPFLTLDFIYDSLPLYQKSSVRSALSRGVKKDIFQRVEKGVYFYDFETIQEFVKYRHLKRIYDTHSKKPRNQWTDIMDAELSAEGYSPLEMTNEDIDALINPKLLEKGIDIMVSEGIYIYQEILDFNVQGSEKLDYDIIKIYDPTWNVEVKFTNNLGVQYLWTGNFEVMEHEWKY